MSPNIPEEIDVYTIPHSRMKDLVHDYWKMVGSNVENKLNFLFVRFCDV